MQRKHVFEIAVLNLPATTTSAEAARSWSGSTAASRAMRRPPPQTFANALSVPRATIELSGRYERQTTLNYGGLAGQPHLDRGIAPVLIAARIEDNLCVFFRYRFWCLRVLRLRNPNLPSTATRSKIPRFLSSWLIMVKTGQRPSFRPIATNRAMTSSGLAGHRRPPAQPHPFS